MHFRLLLLVALLLLPAASAAPNGTMQILRPYPQRLSDRYTTRDGLPAGRALLVRVDGARVRVRTEGGSAELAEGRWRPLPEAETPRAEYPFLERKQIPGREVRSAAQSADGRIWVVTEQGAFRSAGSGFEPVRPPAAYLTGQPPVNIDTEIACVLADPAGSVWLGTNTGIYATDGRSWWEPFDRERGLPYEYVTCLALGRNGDLWAGTTEGVCRWSASGGWSYYWGPRWLPGNHVNDVAVDGSGAAWVATDGGVARLYDRETTLEEKARRYQGITDARHNRRGYVTGCRLRKPGDPSGGHVHEASDNDGLWTALYVAAQSFRWAAARDPQARAQAKRSMDAMLDLVRLTGIPGFPARAVIFRGEEVDGYDPEETVRVPGETEKIWFPSPVDPNVLCKGDTSSDELDGHYFAWHIYHDLVAGDAEKRELRKIVAAVTDNILSHDLTLVGHTGRKTRWGVWSPGALNDDPTWWEERGLNALEILCYLKVAEHICGEPRYARVYRDLIDRHHYLLNTVTQKVAEPWHQMNHSDDEMAFMMYYSLLTLEKDPSIRRVLLLSLERSWKVERSEASPFFNFIYGALTGRPCDVEASVETLREWPWELIDWEARGTHRHDVELWRWSGEGGTRIRTDRALPAGERRLMRWNGNPFQPDGGSRDGRNEEDGTAWLVAYWLGRYHSLIRER